MNITSYRQSNAGSNSNQQRRGQPAVVRPFLLVIVCLMGYVPHTALLAQKVSESFVDIETEKTVFTYQNMLKTRYGAPGHIARYNSIPIRERFLCRTQTGVDSTIII